MAMLAAPRRKQKVINLRAKNSEWSNDTNKFGQKMLEKMGWSAGKGLGANENGIVEHVIARFKNDDKGLGFEDKNDQWTKHEDDFNALLANLSNGNNDEEKLHSGQSLEVKSKKSKARVHYHKFTRGKDLSRYSEKDLANIFGKKSLKNKEPEVVLNEDVKTTEQVFTDKGSMEDYFKSKLAAFKNKTNVNENEQDEEKDYSFHGFSNAENEVNQNEKNDYSFRGFSNDTEEEPNHGFQGFSGFKPASEDIVEKEVIEVVSENKEKKKKRKKNKNQGSVVEDTVQENKVQSQPDDVNLEEKRIKSKKNKNINTENKCVVDESIENEPMPKKSKKNKNKNKLIETTTETTVEQNVPEEDHVPKKKKKRKNNPE